MKKTMSLESVKTKVTELVNEYRLLDNELDYLVNDRYVKAVGNLKSYKESGELDKISEQIKTIKAEKDNKSSLLAVWRYNESILEQEMIFNAFCSIISKYQGKRLGEKTKQKINTELHEMTGFRFYLPSYGYQWSVEFTSASGTGGYKRYTLYTAFIQEVSERVKWLEDNTITHSSRNDFEQVAGIIIENPEKYIAEKNGLLREIENKRNVLEEVISKYNENICGERLSLPYFSIPKHL